MNIVFGMRGELHLQKMIVEQLNNFHFYHKKEKDGKTIYEPITHALQPITFWSYAVPKEYDRQIFTSLFEKADRYNNTFKQQMALTMMRKAMGLKPIPDWKPIKEENKMPLNKEGMRFMHFIPIGIKDDVMGTDEEGFYKEMI